MPFSIKWREALAAECRGLSDEDLQKRLATAHQGRLWVTIRIIRDELKGREVLDAVSDPE